MTEFYDPSPKALQVKTKKSNSYQFKFENVPEGKSFRIELADIKLSTLRPIASRYGKVLGRRFKIVDHSDSDDPCYEVYRLVDERTPPVINPPPPEPPVPPQPDQINPEPSQGHGLSDTWRQQPAQSGQVPSFWQLPRKAGEE